MEESHKDRLLQALGEKRQKAIEQAMPEAQPITDKEKSQTFSKLLKELVRQMQEVNDLNLDFRYKVTEDNYRRVVVSNNLTNDRIELYLNSASDGHIKLNVEIRPDTSNSSVKGEAFRVETYEFDYLEKEVGFMINKSSGMTVPAMKDYIFDWFLNKVKGSK